MYPEAEEAFRTEISIDPENHLALWKLGNTCLARNRSAESLPYLERALALKPDLAQAHRDLGKALMQQQQWEPALEHFRKVTELAPDEPSVHYRMALVYRKLGRSAEEQAELELFQKKKSAQEKGQKVVVIPGSEPEIGPDTSSDEQTGP
jgi:tetratricopeptide (TPR) repeat protein